MGLFDSVFGRKQKQPAIPHGFYLANSTSAMNAAIIDILRYHIREGNDDVEERLVFVAFIVSQCYMLALHKNISSQKLSVNVTEYLENMFSSIQSTCNTTSTPALAENRFREYSPDWDAALQSGNFLKLSHTFMTNYAGPGSHAMTVMELVDFFPARLPNYIDLIKNDLS
jgi:hypothetical protein